MKHLPAIIGLTVIAGMVTIFGTWTYISENYNDNWDIFYYDGKTECSIELPWNLEVVSNGKVYAIQTLMKNGNHEYLWQMHSGKISYLYDVETTFTDSCRAKAFAFRFVEQEKTRMQVDALKKPFAKVKPPQSIEELKAKNYNTLIFVSYQNGDTLKTLEEKQLLDSAIKDLQSQGGGSIMVSRTEKGFLINSLPSEHGLK